MARAFAQMTHGLRQMVRQVRDSASQVASGAGQMAAASDESAKVSVQAASAIDEVTSTMHEMSINVQNVVKNTQVQASSVAETSASIDQMVTSIQRVADTAKLLVDISHRSREEAHTGMATMDKATEGSIAPARRSNPLRKSSMYWGRRADDIGKIIEVIDDLAEQTNLLALNAAIEAARAGEHGLGFAVVAEEVRKLAEKSTQSTKEISDLIEGIQKEAREAVENMEKSTTMVQEGLVLNKDLSVALDKISNVVSEVYKFSQEIGAATTEQSSGSAQIAKATNRLTEITQEINSSVEEQASGAQAVVRAWNECEKWFSNPPPVPRSWPPPPNRCPSFRGRCLIRWIALRWMKAHEQDTRHRAATRATGKACAGRIRRDAEVLKTLKPPWTKIFSCRLSDRPRNIRAADFHGSGDRARARNYPGAERSRSHRRSHQSARQNHSGRRSEKTFR